MQEQPTKALLRKRNQWRQHECNTCYNNCYNWPEWSGHGTPGDRTAPAFKLPDHYVCWSLHRAQRERDPKDGRKRLRVATCRRC